MAQWMRGCLPMQETWVQSLVQEDSKDVTKPMYHNCWGHALEPKGQNFWAQGAAATEAGAPQGERPPQWEACTPHLESSTHSSKLRKDG